MIVIMLASRPPRVVRKFSVLIRSNLILVGALTDGHGSPWTLNSSAYHRGPLSPLESPNGLERRAMIGTA